MDFEKEYTIKDFARLRGVSQQAIYKQLSGKLSPFVVVRDGQKYISGEFFRQASAQPEHSTNSTEDSTEVEQPVERDTDSENYREILDILREQLREKDNQISSLLNQVEELFNQLKAKDETATQLITLLENTQKIEAGRLLMEAKGEEVETEANATERRRGLFAIFKKNK